MTGPAQEPVGTGRAGEQVAAFEQQLASLDLFPGACRRLAEREQAEAARLAEDREWARDHLTACGLDPDDPASVREGFDAVREGYALHLRGRPGEIDAEAYWSLVYAICAANGWVNWPLDWPGHPVLMTQPFRNLIPRRTPDA